MNLVSLELNRNLRCFEDVDHRLRNFRTNTISWKKYNFSFLLAEALVWLGKANALECFQGFNIFQQHILISNLRGKPELIKGKKQKRRRQDSNLRGQAQQISSLSP